jgi:tryptophanyl-tRNA synthetase
MISFIFTKWLQDVFPQSYLVIQMADDEKYYFKDLEFEEVYQLGFENAKDIIACGFDPERTLIFSNHDYIAGHREAFDLAHTMFKKVKISTLKAVFGLDDSCNLGQFVWPIYQSAAAYSQFYSFLKDQDPLVCGVAYAIDQDPYFRIARDVAPKIEAHKPAGIMTKFLPSPEGSAKMSSTATSSEGKKLARAIFMTDPPANINIIVNKHFISGGQETAELQREKGADLEKDMAYQYLRHFLMDENLLERIAQEYASGEMMTGQVKKELIAVLTEFITAHQERREKVTSEDIERFYDDSKFNSE